MSPTTSENKVGKLTTLTPAKVASLETGLRCLNNESRADRSRRLPPDVRVNDVGLFFGFCNLLSRSRLRNRYQDVCEIVGRIDHNIIFKIPQDTARFRAEKPICGW